MQRLFQYLRGQWLLLSILGSVVGALFWPLPISWQGAATDLSHLGVSVVFFLQGVSLSLEELKRGTRALRLHVMVQAVSFILLPLAAFSFDLALGWLLPLELRLGFLLLSFLPSTIKSASVMSTLAGGNPSASIVVATLSGLLGTLVTPLWMTLLLSRIQALWPASGLPASAPIFDLARELLGLIVLPFLVGMVCAPRLSARLGPVKVWAPLFASSVVAYVVYLSLSRSMTSGHLTRVSGPFLLGALFGCVAFFGFATAITYFLSRRMRLPRDETIVALFAAPQKSLATGAPLFELGLGSEAAGTLLIPLLIYHPLQLFLGTWLVARWIRSKRDRGVLP